MQRGAGELDLQQLPVEVDAGGVDRPPDRIELIQRRAGAVLLHPQPLAQHFLHRFADRIVLGAGHRLDLGSRDPQLAFHDVGGVEQARQGLPAAAGAALAEEGKSGHEGGENGDAGEDQAQGGRPVERRGSLNGGPGAGKSLSAQGFSDLAPGLTGPYPTLNILRLMSADIPEILDAWRMVAARRGFEGRVPLSSLSRLRDALEGVEGDAAFVIEFDRDALQVPYVELRIDAELPLLCQRTLQRFLFPVHATQRLGLLRDEADEASLPPGYEALLVGGEGELRPLELVEDELILAIPVVPMTPGSESVERDWPVTAEEEVRANPFAGLAALKKQDRDN